MRVQNSPALSPAQVNSNLAPSPQHCEKDTHSVTLLLHLHSCWSLSLGTVFLQQTPQHQYFSYMCECRDHRDDMNLCLCLEAHSIPPSQQCSAERPDMRSHMRECSVAHNTGQHEQGEWKDPTLTDWESKGAHKHSRWYCPHRNRKCDWINKDGIEWKVV